MIEATLDAVRCDIRPGDAIFTACDDWLSFGIRLVTGISSFRWIAPVSHAMIVMANEGGRIRLAESTLLTAERGDHLAGVIETDLDARIETFDRVWWLPFSERSRARWNANEAAALAWLVERIADCTPYDAWQAWQSGHDWLDKALGKWSPTYARESWDKLYCSELVAAAWKVAGVLPKSWNTSEFSPYGLARLAVYAPGYAQIKGRRKEISGYNIAPI